MPSDAGTAAPLPLKEQFTRGLDAPICLTWELTYACNLACVHCLSSSGRRDPRELTTAEARRHHRRAGGHAGVLRQHRRRRADDAARLLRPGRPTPSTGGSASSSPPTGPRLTAERARAAGRAWTTSTCRSASTGRRPRPTTPCAVRAPSPPPAGPWTTWPRPASAPSRSAWSSPARTSSSSTSSRRMADDYGAQLRLTRLRPSGRGGRHLGRAAPDGRAAAAGSTTGWSSGPTCSPATRSSTSPRWASRSTGSTSAGRAGWSA